MKAIRKRVAITEGDWTVSMGHAADTMAALGVPGQEGGDVAAFVLSLKGDVVEG